jgi:hypothetical protein
MEASKELVGELLINPEGARVRKFDLKELVPVRVVCGTGRPPARYAR